MALIAGNYSDFVGAYDQDAIALTIIENPRNPNIKDHTSRQIKIYSGYQFVTGVFTQPSAFSFRIGNGSSVKELRSLIHKGDWCTLSIAGVNLASGVIEGTPIPEGEFVQMDIKGRDWMAPFIMSDVTDEISFNEPTYFELVKRIMEIVGVADHELVSSNDANKWKIGHIGGAKKRRTRKGKITAKPVSANALVEQIETGMVGPGGGKVILQSIRAKVGQSWYQWLDKQLKLAGLLLWAGANGEYILSAPDTQTAPWYRLVCKEGQTREQNNIISGGVKNDSTNEHTSIIVNAMSGAGGGGRQKAFAVATNLDAVEFFGDLRPRAIEDDDAKTPIQARWVAGRIRSEEKRAGHGLIYTLSGHRLPSLFSDDQMAVVTPDTLIEIDDDIRDVHGDFYIHQVTYSRNPYTSMRLEMMNPWDLSYFSELATDS